MPPPLALGSPRTPGRAGVEQGPGESSAATVSAEEWIDAFVRELGMSNPDPELVNAILELAATAAHASERVAAPIACWLGGASGRPLGELNEIAARVRA